MNRKIIIVTTLLALLSLGAYAVLKRRNENEPNEMGGNGSDYQAMYPTETKNFRLSEFACHDGTPVPEQFYGNVSTLMHNLQILRDAIGFPIFINSGYRSPAYNQSIGGAANSYHMKAMAGDLRVPGMTPKQLKAKIESLIADGKMINGGIGLYPSFVHYDVGPTRRWIG